MISKKLNYEEFKNLYKNSHCPCCENEKNIFLAYHAYRIDPIHYFKSIQYEDRKFHEKIKLAIKYKSDREFIKKLINDIKLPAFSNFKNTKDFVKAVNNIVNSIIKNVQLDRDLVIAEILQKLNWETKDQVFQSDQENIVRGFKNE
jgi:hypothetical protein